MAAGISIAEDRVAEFRRQFNGVAAEALKPGDLIPKMRLDAVCGLAEIDASLVGELERIEPFGQGNPPVHLCVENVRHARAPQRIKEEHWKMWLTDGSKTVEAVWWGAGEQQCPTGDFDVAAVPERSDFDKLNRLQLRILECRER